VPQLPGGLQRPAAGAVRLEAARRRLDDLRAWSPDLSVGALELDIEAAAFPPALVWRVVSIASSAMTLAARSGDGAHTPRAVGSLVVELADVVVLYRRARQWNTMTGPEVILAHTATGVLSSALAAAATTGDERWNGNSWAHRARLARAITVNIATPDHRTQALSLTAQLLPFAASIRCRRDGIEFASLAAQYGVHLFGSRAVVDPVRAHAAMVEREVARRARASARAAIAADSERFRTEVLRPTVEALTALRRHLAHAPQRPLDGDLTRAVAAAEAGRITALLDGDRSWGHVEPAAADPRLGADTDGVAASLRATLRRYEVRNALVATASAALAAALVPRGDRLTKPVLGALVARGVSRLGLRRPGAPPQPGRAARLVVGGVDLATVVVLADRRHRAAHTRANWVDDYLLSLSTSLGPDRLDRTTIRVLAGLSSGIRVAALVRHRRGRGSARLALEVAAEVLDTVVPAELLVRLVAPPLARVEDSAAAVVEVAAVPDLVEADIVEVVRRALLLSGPLRLLDMCADLDPVDAARRLDREIARLNAWIDGPAGLVADPVVWLERMATDLRAEGRVLVVAVDEVPEWVHRHGRVIAAILAEGVQRAFLDERVDRVAVTALTGAPGADGPEHLTFVLTPVGGVAAPVGDGRSTTLITTLARAIGASLLWESTPAGPLTFQLAIRRPPTGRRPRLR